MSEAARLQTVREFEPADSFFSVSVVVPFYKGQKFIESTIGSILCQTVKPAEVIIIDDGSPDPPILPEDLMDQVTVVRRPNHGAAASRNFGGAMAKNRWLAFCDQDDLWVPTKLEKQLRLVSEVPEIHCVLTDYAEFSEEGRGGRSHLSYAPAGFWSQEQYENGFVVRQPITGKLSTFQPGITSTPIVLKEFFLSSGGFDTAVEWGAEDTCFHFRCLCVTPFGVIPEVLMLHRRHPDAGSADNLLQLRRTVDAWRHIAGSYPQARPHRAELIAGIDAMRLEIQECERFARRQKLKRLLGIR